MQVNEAIALDSIQAIAASFGSSFDAEKIVDTIEEKDGTRYYKVRWVKYSWEPAASFTHLEHLIRTFWSQSHHETNENIGEGSKKLLPISPRPPDPLPQYPHCTIESSAIHQNHVTQQQQLHQQLPGLSTEKTNNSILSDLDQVVASFTSVHTTSQENQHQQNRQKEQVVQSISHSLQATVNETEGLPILPVNLHPALHLETVVQNSGVAEQALLKDDVPMLPAIKMKDPEQEKKRRKIPGTCDICGKQFKSTTNIAAHRKLHTEEKKFECPQCGKKFRRKLHLTRHVKSHAGIKGFSCEICDAKFSSKWYMQAHAVIHTGDKPFQCTICEKRFNNKANLKKHKLTHGNQRPYVCNVCGQTYRQSYDLKRHMASHTDPVTSFSCSQCGKIFARKSYLQRHLLIHTSERKYECTHCGRKFLQRGQLNFHVKNQHKTVRNESNNSETDANMRDSIKPMLPDCRGENSELIEPRLSSENDNYSINDSNKTSVYAIRDSERLPENVKISRKCSEDDDNNEKREVLYSKVFDKLSVVPTKQNEIANRCDKIEAVSKQNFNEIIPLDRDGQQRSYVDLLLSPDDNDRALTTKTLSFDNDKEQSRKSRVVRDISNSLNLTPRNCKIVRKSES
ncbi:uncharacterized protein [Clytia hemisphaerica]|uniref:C2H2-type domain-containing protein n=1 Tax=Clytia hemisphaerica TaxID=252671 RepID=A0A7M5U5E7_9CNID